MLGAHLTSIPVAIRDWDISKPRPVNRPKYIGISVYCY